MAIVAQLRERRRERELAILESGQPKSWGRETLEAAACLALQ